MPFAGPCNVGTAFVLAQVGSYGKLIADDEVTFEEKAGLVSSNFQTGRWVVARALPRRGPLTIGEKVSPAVMAEACGIGSAIEMARRALVASCGAVFVSLDSRTLLPRGGEAARRCVSAICDRARHRNHLYVTSSVEGGH